MAEGALIRLDDACAKRGRSKGQREERNAAPAVDVPARLREFARELNLMAAELELRSQTVRSLAAGAKSVAERPAEFRHEAGGTFAATRKLVLRPDRPRKIDQPKR